MGMYFLILVGQDHHDITLILVRQEFVQNLVSQVDVQMLDQSSLDHHSDPVVKGEARRRQICT